MPTCAIPNLSARYSTLPALSSPTTRPTSMVTVPSFGFGIRPRVPRILPSLPTLLIMSGVATVASKSRKPPWIFSTRSSLPTTSAPAASASRALSPSAKTATRTVLPVPFGQRHRAADLLVGLAGVDAEAEVGLDGLVELGGLDLLGEANRLERRVEALLLDLGRCLACSSFRVLLMVSFLPW